MQRIFRMLLFWNILLNACATMPASPQIVPSETIEFSPTPAVLPTTAVPHPKLAVTVGTPHIEQPPNPEGQVTSAPADSQNCAYQWAYQDLPELSSRVQGTLQTLQPEAQATAFAFGENCVRADGNTTFLPMETDFNITLQAGDLANESDLGETIVEVMQIITAIPPELIAGPRPGRISLTFQSGGDQKNMTFYVNQYQELPAGLSSAEIFQQLQTLQ